MAIPQLWRSPTAIPSNTLENQHASVTLRVIPDKQPHSVFTCRIGPHLPPFDLNPKLPLPWPFDALNNLRRAVQSWIIADAIPTEPIQPMDFELWLKRYPTSKQNCLRTAAEDLMTGRSHPTNRVNVFLKIEASDKATDPRNITPRSHAFMALVGPYWAAAENLLGKLPFLVKGLTPHQRDKHCQPVATFPNFISTDFSRFDRSISTLILNEIEIFIMEQLYPPAEHPDFHHCLELGLHTKGQTPLGVTYDIQGTRCSGDMQTSIMNGLINRFLTWLVMPHDQNTWVAFHEGDDGIIGCTDSARDHYTTMFPTYDLLGFDVKRVISRQLDDHTFCGRILYTQHGSVRSFSDVRRTLQKFHVNLSQIPSQPYIHAKSLSLLCQNQSTPVLTALFTSIIRLTVCPTPKQISKLRQYDKELFYKYVYHASTLRTRPIPPEARVALTKHGLSIAEQFALEDHYRYWTILGFIPSNPIIAGESPMTFPYDRVMHASTSEDLISFSA